MKHIPWIACVLVVVGSYGCQSTGPAGTSAGVEPEPAPAAVAEDEQDYKNTVKWTTASEVDNFGYDIYRALSEEGPFERITEDPLPGAGTTDEPTSYVFEDDAIDPTRGYWYYIESISMAGERERFSPVTYIKPKKPVEEE